MADRKAGMFHLGVLVLAVVVVFGNTLLNGFVWDDTVLLVGNGVYRDFDLRTMFLSLGNGLEYQPLRDLSYALDYLFWGERAFGFHLTNLVLYGANVVALYYLMQALLPLFDRAGERGAATRAGTVSLLTALLFALHPLHSEAVSFITCRNVLLSGLFFFLSVRCYLRFCTTDPGKGNGSYGWAILWFLAALLTKATVVILPLVLLLLIPWAPVARHRRLLLSLLPFFALALGFFFLYRAVGYHSGVINATASPGSSLADRIAVALQIPFFYLQKLFLPLNLSAEYDVHFARSLKAPVALFASGGLIALVAAAGGTWRRQPVIIFSLAWFLVALLPVLNLFPTNPVVADRYAYLPVVPFCFLIAFFGTALQARFGRLAWLVPGAILLAWGALTVSRNAVWRSDKTLFAAALHTSPTAMAYVNLADQALREKRFDEALAYAAKARELNPSLVYEEYVKGYAAFDQGDYGRASEWFQAALARRKSFGNALYYLALTFEKQGKVADALENYNKVLVSKDQAMPVAVKRGAAAAVERLRPVVEPELEQLRRLAAANPGDPRPRMQLALSLDRLGFYDEALHDYGELEQLGMHAWQLFFNMGNVYKKLDQPEQAASYYEKCLVLNPEFVDALNNAGLAYTALARYDKAIAAFQRAIALAPGYGYAPLNLAVAYLRAGNREKARTYLDYTEGRFPELRGQVGFYRKELQ